LNPSTSPLPVESSGNSGPNAAGLARKNVELSSVKVIKADFGNKEGVLCDKGGSENDDTASGKKIITVKIECIKASGTRCVRVGRIFRQYIAILTDCNEIEC